jgi:hypothetical protein
MPHPHSSKRRLNRVCDSLRNTPPNTGMKAYFKVRFRLFTEKCLYLSKYLAYLAGTIGFIGKTPLKSIATSAQFTALFGPKMKSQKVW